MKVVIFVSNGTEDSEYVTTRDLLRRANIEVTTLSIDEKIVKLSHGLNIISDGLIDEYDTSDAIILPGGKVGVNNFLSNDKLLNIIREHHSLGKLTCAICAAPVVLHKAGILKNNSFTCYDGFEEGISDGCYIKKPTIRSSNVITGRSMNYTIEFALNIIDYLLGDEATKRVKEGILRVD